MTGAVSAKKAPAIEERVGIQFGKSLTADFENNTWTFLMEGNYDVSAGDFVIIPRKMWEKEKLSFNDLQEEVIRLRMQGGTQDSAVKSGLSF